MENEIPLVITIVGAESSGKTVLAKQLAKALSCVWVPEYAREYLEKLDRPYEFEDLEEIARGQWNLIDFKHSAGDFSPFPKSTLPFGRKEELPQGALHAPITSPLTVLLPGSLTVLPPSPLKGVNGDSTITIQTEISDYILALKSLEKEIVIVDSGMLTISMWAMIKYGRSIPFVEEVMKKDPTSLYILCRPRMEWELDPLREAPSLVDRVWIYNQYLQEMVVNNFVYTIIST